MQGEFPFDQDLGAGLLFGAVGLRFWEGWIGSGRILTLTRRLALQHWCPQ